MITEQTHFSMIRYVHTSYTTYRIYTKRHIEMNCSPGSYTDASVSDLCIAHRYMNVESGRQNIIILFWK
jgi:hypothetical protein